MHRGVRYVYADPWVGREVESRDERHGATWHAAHVAPPKNVRCSHGGGRSYAVRLRTYSPSRAIPRLLSARCAERAIGPCELKVFAI